MRYLFDDVVDDLTKKMVFIGGPRQCGKTTLSKAILKKISPNVLYLNWDASEDRSVIRNKRWSDHVDLIVFDELHKMLKWKSWIKGVFDKKMENQSFLVTGSARLDVYKKGGDSLLGRYHYWRLHPMGLDELPRGMKPAQALERLMSVGGFPEPFLDGDERAAKRWRRERQERVIQEDIRDLENLKTLQQLDLLVNLLRSRVGGGVSYGNLARDLEVAPQTVQHWVQILEKMYFIFQVFPYTNNVARAVQKQPKIYFFDNGDVQTADDQLLGARFENLVATHLLKRLHYLEDFSGDRFELSYLRDRDGREVDFVISKNHKIEEIIEVKYSDSEPSRSLIYFAEQLKPPRATQIVAQLKEPYQKGKLLVTNPMEYFSERCYQSAKTSP